MLRVIRSEFRKLHRARVVLGTVAVVVFFAFMAGALEATWDPDATLTWEGLLFTGAMYMAGWWGILVFSLAASHLFGAEFSDGTAGTALTTPIRREQVVVAKFVVLAVWVVALSLLSVAAFVGIGMLNGINGFEWALVRQSLRDSLMTALLLYLTLPTIALLAMVGRGYLAPMMFATAMMTASWACGFLGWAEWFPWAMPATIAGGLGPPDLLLRPLGAGSWAITLGVFAVGLIAVFTYVNRADSPV